MRQRRTAGAYKGPKTLDGDTSNALLNSRSMRFVTRSMSAHTPKSDQVRQFVRAAFVITQTLCDEVLATLGFVGLSRAGHFFMAGSPKRMLLGAILIGVTFGRNVFSRRALALFIRIGIGGHYLLSCPALPGNNFWLDLAVADWCQEPYGLVGA